MILALAARGRTTSTQAWARALQNIAPLQRDGTLTLPTVVDGLAERHGAAAALIGEHDHVTYTELAQRKNQYARWALERSTGLSRTQALSATLRVLIERDALDEAEQLLEQHANRGGLHSGEVARFLGARGRLRAAQGRPKEALEGVGVRNR